MHVLVCVRCGSTYSAEREKDWGRTAGSSGYGPTPVCTAIVPDPYGPKGRNGELSNQVCRGSLSPDHVEDDERDELVESGALLLEQPIEARPGRR